MFLRLPGELDDQNRVLGCQSDQDYEADLGQDIVVHPAHQNATDRGKQAHWYDQDHGERSEEHTSELQSPDLVCRLLLEKKKNEVNEARRARRLEDTRRHTRGPPYPQASERGMHEPDGICAPRPSLDAA